MREHDDRAGTLTVRARYSFELITLKGISMDRLALFLTLLSAAAVAAALITVCAILGYTSLWVIVFCVILALCIAYPSATLVAHRVQEWRDAKEAEARSTHSDFSK